MATEKRLINAYDCPCKDCMKKLHECESRLCEEFAEWMLTGVDAVEVVRCKDCTHYAEASGKDSGKPCGYGSCKVATGIIGIVYDEDFCSYGERKDND